MDKLNRRELLQYIKNQDSKSTEYRKRFRDLVAAYKGLQNEKSALESTLKALSSSNTGGSVSQDISTGITNPDSEACIQQGESDGQILLQVQNTVDQSDSADSNRISALTNALSTLTQEKTRSENTFLADKRQIKQEVDDLKNELEEKQKQFEQEKAGLQKTIRDLRSDLAKEQRQRQEDQNQQTLMMRELQAKLISERASREKFEQQYESLLWQQKNSKSAGSAHQRSVEEYEKILGELSKEMERLRKLHEDALEKARKPNPVLVELQNEMKDIKVKHQEAVADEQRLSSHAKAELRSLALSSENRITSLEAKVSELSQMVGNYDRLRTQDLTNIQKLKERIVQLDMEKSLLLEQQIMPMPTSMMGSGHGEQEDSNLDVHALVDKITKLKSLLHLANQRSQKPMDTNLLLRLEECSVTEADLHSRCKEELEQLKEEFEQYKARAQTVLRSKAAKDHESHGELDSLKHQVNDLKGRLQSARLHQEKQVKETEEKLQACQMELKQQLRQLRMQLETEHSVKLIELEQQIQKQRERTLALLDEKDKDLAQKNRELASLRMTFNEVQLSPFTNATESCFSDADDSKISADKILPSAGSQDNLPEMLSQAMTNATGDHLILHYVQDIARKDVEISNLRRLRHQAETALRDLQRESQSKAERYVDDLEAMQAKIYRLESSEEGMNMEYLKNVVLRYVLCKDIPGKRRILNAIAAVLHFTAKELDQARMGLTY